MLGTSAAAIGEDDEAERCAQFLRDSSATAAAELAASCAAGSISGAAVANRAGLPGGNGREWLGYLAFLRVISERKSPCRACACAGASVM